MSKGNPEILVESAPQFNNEGSARTKTSSRPPYGLPVDDNDLRRLRFKVKQLEDEKLALEKQIRQLTTSLATTLSKNIASSRTR